MTHRFGSRWFWSRAVPVWLLNSCCHCCSGPPVHFHICSFPAFSVALSRHALVPCTLIEPKVEACAGAPAEVTPSAAAKAAVNANKPR